VLIKTATRKIVLKIVIGIVIWSYCNRQSIDWIDKAQFLAYAYAKPVF